MHYVVSFAVHALEEFGLFYFEVTDIVLSFIPGLKGIFWPKSFLSRNKISLFLDCYGFVFLLIGFNRAHMMTLNVRIILREINLLLHLMISQRLLFNIVLFLRFWPLNNSNLLGVRSIVFWRCLHFVILSTAPRWRIFVLYLIEPPLNLWVVLAIIVTGQFLNHFIFQLLLFHQNALLVLIQPLLQILFAWNFRNKYFFHRWRLLSFRMLILLVLVT